MAKDPKEVAAMIKKKVEEQAAMANAQRSARTPEEAERLKKVNQERTVMRAVVIPYFQNLERLSPDLKFNPVYKFDPANRDDVYAVSFRIGRGAEHVIELTSGGVRIYRRGGPGQAFGLDLDDHDANHFIHLAI